MNRRMREYKIKCVSFGGDNINCWRVDLQAQGRTLVREEKQSCITQIGGREYFPTARENQEAEGEAAQR